MTKEKFETHPFGRADAAGAGRGEPGLAYGDVPATDLAPVSGFAPRLEVHVRHRAAGHARVQEVRGQIEGGPLHVRVVVHVLAHDLGESRLAHLGELVLAESDVGVISLVPETIAFTRLAELDGDDAGERRADEATLQRSLAHATC